MSYNSVGCLDYFGLGHFGWPGWSADGLADAGWASPIHLVICWLGNLRYLPCSLFNNVSSGLFVWWTQCPWLQGKTSSNAQVLFQSLSPLPKFPCPQKVTWTSSQPVWEWSPQSPRHSEENDCGHFSEIICYFSYYPVSQSTIRLQIMGWPTGEPTEKWVCPWSCFKLRVHLASAKITFIIISKTIQSLSEPSLEHSGPHFWFLLHQKELFFFTSKQTQNLLKC